MPRLTGKVALVTGASRGIGAAIARKLASDGAAVAVNYARNAAAADQVVADVERAGGRAVAVRADLTDVGQIEPMVARAADALGGRIDVLVNNAGWAQFGRPLGTLDLDHYHRQMDLNVRGLLFA
ncbi:MAG TPA: SDR family NAD(P)-dependent oxidoreductase, partial [Tepidisphaeraceae bacterium]|nr:SDR family NAD(P)-dependent oxidoreductase [Tepidisphaeraceae bacterium]